jgi:hypothetical protein
MNSRLPLSSCRARYAAVVISWRGLTNGFAVERRIGEALGELVLIGRLAQTLLGDREACRWARSLTAAAGESDATVWVATLRGRG